MILYDYFRSSAAYRVRLALAIKGMEYDRQVISLLDGAHHHSDFKLKNPQGLLPVLQQGQHLLTQSLAICEYLDEAYPEAPALLPKHLIDRAHVRAMAHLIACDIHPLNNRRVLMYLEHELNIDASAKQRWYQHWVQQGFDALEVFLQKYAHTWAFGDSLTLVDVCLQPQIYNAQRFEVGLMDYPLISRLAQAYTSHKAFLQAHPDAWGP
jgi:maleylacetoacetate isomerase